MSVAVFDSLFRLRRVNCFVKETESEAASALVQQARSRIVAPGAICSSPGKQQSARKLTTATDAVSRTEALKKKLRVRFQATLKKPLFGENPVFCRAKCSATVAADLSTLDCGETCTMRPQDIMTIKLKTIIWVGNVARKKS